MPKILFSKFRMHEFKELLQNVKRSRRIDIVLNCRRRKTDIQCIVVQKAKHETCPSPLSPQADRKFQPTLENLLRDKKYVAAFRAFLRSEFSEENMEFWLACEEFRATTSPADLFWKAEEIYQDFIHPFAWREVNIDHQIREKIKTSLEEPSVSCFAEAQRHVYQLMDRDSRPRFLRSDAYLSLRHKTQTLWYM